MQLTIKPWKTLGLTPDIFTFKQKISSSVGLVWTIFISTFLITTIRSLRYQQLLPINISRQQVDYIKFLDPILVLLFTGAILLLIPLRGRQKIAYWKIVWFICIEIILLISMLSIIVWDVNPYYALQSVFFIMRPIILFMIFTNQSWNIASYKKMLFFIYSFSVINAFMALSQYFRLRSLGDYFSADDIIGLFTGAHQQATFSYTITLLLIGSTSLFRGKLKRIIWISLIFLNILSGYVSQGQIATGIFITILIVGTITHFLYRNQQKPIHLLVRTLIAIFILFTILLGLSKELIQNTPTILVGNLAERISRDYYARNPLEDLGVVRMLNDFNAKALENPFVLLIGLGPSNFGSPACLTKVIKDQADGWVTITFLWETAASDIERTKSLESRLLGLSSKTSILGIILGELGIVCLVIFIFLISWSLSFKSSYTDIVSNNLFFWLKATYIFILFQSIIKILGSWDDITTTTLVIAGLSALQNPYVKKEQDDSQTA